jgi:putative NADH-flavin reductase
VEPSHGSNRGNQSRIEPNRRFLLNFAETGKAGSVILKELVDRGHTVVAAARTPEKVQKLKNVSTVQDDLSDPAKIARIVKGVDAVVSAYGPPPDDTSQIIGAMDRLVKGVEQAGGPRLIVVGGAGSLFVGIAQLGKSPPVFGGFPAARSRQETLT